MASARMNLYDSDFLGWYRVATEGDISNLKTKLNDHEVSLINSEIGLHGVRVWDGKLQQTNDMGTTWVDVIGNSGTAITVVDNLLSDSPNDALSAKQGKVLDGKITTLNNTVTANALILDEKADKTLATTTQDGLFSSAEKIKLASLSPDINPITVEDSLTSTSTTNALSANKGRELSVALSTLEDFVEDNVVIGSVAVTQTEKDAWSAKSNFSGSYTDLTDKPTIPTLNDTLTSTATSDGLTANQGRILDGKITTLTNVVDANTTLINTKADKTLATDTQDGLFSSAEKIKLASLTPGGGGTPVTVENVLTSDSTTNALSAKMGKDLKGLVDGKTDQSDFETLQTYVNTNVPIGGLPVTQTEKNTWNAKSDFSGSYNDLSNKPSIPSPIILNNTTSSTSTTEAATANVVKQVYDLANSKASTASYVGTIGTVWEGAGAPYTQTISIPGMLSSDTPFVFPVYSMTNATAMLEDVTWKMVSKITTNNNSIIITCFEDKPITPLNIQLKVVR